MTRKVVILLFLLLALLPAVLGEEKSAIAPNASFDKMKTLDGMWVGSFVEGGKEYPTNTRFMMVSDGSALMAWMAEGTSEEMVTIFHMDGKDFMATHYCAAHNQPRLVATAGTDPNRIVFKFKDGTNIGPNDGHMQEVTFILDGPDHHIEEWTSVDNHGKPTTGRFDFHRKK